MLDEIVTENAPLRSAEGDQFRAERSRAYMEHVRDACMAVRRLRMEIDAARELMLPGGVSYDSQPTSPNAYGDAIPDGVARLDDMVREFATEQAEFVGVQREAHEALSRIADERGRCALTFHYLLGMTWEETATKMSYSEQHAKLIARAALVELYDHLPTAWRPPRHPAL